LLRYNGDGQQLINSPKVLPMILVKVQEFIAKVVAKLAEADSIINALQSKVSLLEGQILVDQATIEEYKEAIAGSEAGEAPVLAELETAIAALTPEPAPALAEAEVAALAMNDEANPQQFEEAIVEIAVETEAVEFEAEAAPTLATPEETPTEVIVEATEAIAEYIAAE